MQILILGGSGMLGHELIVRLNSSADLWATVRGDAQSFPLRTFLDGVTILGGVDALRFETVEQAVEAAQPDVVINCIGLIKQHEAAQNALLAIDLNTRLPHQLAALCARHGSRLIHISTDCVFQGMKGHYVESDPTDALDLYGKSKALGEVTDFPNALTIRTSIIGRELCSRYGLLEWFLAQQGSVKGYRQAIFSGFPTYAIADVLRDFVLPRPDLSGLYHIAAAPINKYDLLELFKRAYTHNIEIFPDDTVKIDRSLNSDRFRALTGFAPAPWEQMVEQMARSSLPYENWKAPHAPIR